MAALSTYNGTSGKLILAFDIGTTHSGISYCILSPGQVFQPKGVALPLSQCPGQGSLKIPNIIYYDDDGVVRAAGAETLDDGMYERAEENGWNKAQWFKMHLRPRTIRERDNLLPPLPVNKSAIEVLADFLKYLFMCSKSYLEDTQPDGKDFWPSIEHTTEFVLSYTNGWGGLQQLHMYKASVSAGLIPDTAAGKRRLSFVSEGEANLYFATQHGLSQAVSKEAVIIVDAGGRTINISAYAYTMRTTPPSYKPITPPRCYLHGSISVSDNLRVFLSNSLVGSEFVEDIDHIVQCFDNGTKLRFRNPEEVQFIKFGRSTINDPTFNIQFGQLKLHGIDVASFFKPSVECTINALKEIKDQSALPIKQVVFLGGFAANDWFYESIKKAIVTLGITVLRPHCFGGTAVSVGAIAFKLDRNARWL